MAIDEDAMQSFHPEIEERNVGEFLFGKKADGSPERKEDDGNVEIGLMISDDKNRTVPIHAGKGGLVCNVDLYPQHFKTILRKILNVKIYPGVHRFFHQESTK